MYVVAGYTPQLRAVDGSHRHAETWRGFWGLVVRPLPHLPWLAVTQPAAQAEGVLHTREVAGCGTAEKLSGGESVRRRPSAARGPVDEDGTVVDRRRSVGAQFASQVARGPDGEVVDTRRASTGAQYLGVAGPLPDGWTAHFDDQSGEYFYTNAAGESTWECPSLEV